MRLRRTFRDYKLVTMKNPRSRLRPLRLATMPAGEFKARCLAVMERVARERVPLVITKRGRAVAKLVPVEEEPPELFGYMAGTIEILGDVVSPLDVEWEAGR